jgi:hypothetical protein
VVVNTREIEVGESRQAGREGIIGDERQGVLGDVQTAKGGAGRGRGQGPLPQRIVGQHQSLQLHQTSHLGGWEGGQGAGAEIQAPHHVPQLPQLRCIAGTHFESA